MASRKAKLLILRLCVELHPKKGGICPLCGEPYARIDGTHVSPYDEKETIRRHICRKCPTVFQSVGKTGKKPRQKREKKNKH